jgi:hypothetical protein
VLTRGAFNQGKGKTRWTKGDRSLGKLKWRAYPIPPR